MSADFLDLRRQQFRRYYQPTRILLGVMSGPQPSGVNVITLCFTSSCSYKPPMMMFAVQRRTLSYELMLGARDCVLAVPGERIAAETLLCGTQSGRDLDKAKECGFTLLESKTVSVPGLVQAIANLEVEIMHRVPSGDHLVVLSRFQRFAVNTSNEERNLLSVGPDHDGYRILANRGIHRIAVVERDLDPLKGSGNALHLGKRGRRSRHGAARGSVERR